MNIIFQVDVTTGNYSYVDDDGFVYRDITDELGVPYFYRLEQLE